MWWLIGVPFIAWGVYAVANSIIAAYKEPSVGGAALAGIMLGAVSTMIGLVLSLLAWILS